MLYNIPVFTKISIAPAAVTELAAMPGVIGIKDGGRDLEYLQLVLQAGAGADFAVLTGSDTLLLASLVLGAHGMIAAGMNLVPDLGRVVFDAVKAGDLGTAEATQRLLSTIVQACRAGQPPAGWKAALAWAGISPTRWSRRPHRSPATRAAPSPPTSTPCCPRPADPRSGGLECWKWPGPLDGLRDVRRA